MNILAKSPAIFKENIIFLILNLQKLEIQLPKLLNKTEERLAKRPISAISLLFRPVLVKKTPNIPP
jgi:hypothetical protein